ncbi:MAG: hypothetical protein AAFS08_11320, partial [Pseudomonadota bacterium]
MPEQRELYLAAWQEQADAEFERIQADMASNPISPEEAAALEEANPWVEPEPSIGTILDERLDDIEADLKELAETTDETEISEPEPQPD